MCTVSLVIYWHSGFIMVIFLFQFYSVFISPVLKERVLVVCIELLSNASFLGYVILLDTSLFLSVLG